MVKITDGKSILEVSQGAFDDIYRLQGYRIFKDNTQESKTVESTVPEKTEDEKFLEEITEKPISQWNKEEVKRYAALNNIDITGTKNANEAKERIKSFLNAEE